MKSNIVLSTEITLANVLTARKAQGGASGVERYIADAIVAENSTPLKLVVTKFVKLVKLISSLI